MALLTPNEHIQVEIHAVASGQAVLNVLHYKVHSTAPGTHTLAAWLDAFRTIFRVEILPLLHETYDVQAYSARTIEGMIDLNPEALPADARPVLRFNDQEVLQGAAADVGGVATPALPTYAAVSVAKVCGPVTKPDLTPLTGEKLLKGGMRWGPIVEADTQTDEPNALDETTVSDWQSAVDGILSISVDTTTCQMEVLSFFKNTLPRREGLTPVFARAHVNSVLVNPYASTQVSRKQRPRGGA